MIDAQERLGSLSISALAFGNVSKVESARLLAKLKRAATDTEVRSTTRSADPGELAAIGIGYEVTKKE
jgi:hypothetical protein